MKAAILLNDSQKALSYCIEKGWGREYASIRGKKLYELNNMAATDEEQEIVEAISIYEDVVTKIQHSETFTLIKLIRAVMIIVSAPKNYIITG